MKSLAEIRREVAVNTLGAMHVFPLTTVDGDQKGITYRQWLIGQLASSLSVSWLSVELEPNARAVVAMADALIEAQIEKKPEGCEDSNRVAGPTF
jgi:dihydroxyacetone kinase